MNQKELKVLRKNKLTLYAIPTEDIVLLQEILAEELAQRQDVRNKELKLELAKKVEDTTGKSQGVDILKAELFIARKKYAKRMSQTMNDSSDPLGLLEPLSSAEPMRQEYTKEIKATAPSTVITMRLTDQVGPDGVPKWSVHEKQDDGTEKLLGIQ